VKSRILGALLCAALIGACGACSDEPEGERPSILLFTVDTLRADHLGCYGYFRETSPRIDALAAAGVRFERAIATSGTTLPSHLSIMTGLYPHQHGYVANKGTVEGPFQPSAGRVPAAQFLQRAGYVTAAFVSGSTVKRTTGLQHGFDEWDQPETLHRRGAQTNAAALAWLSRYAREHTKRPFFLWIHYWDPHEPNDPPPEYRAMFRADERLERLVAERGIDAARLEARFSDTEIARLFYPEHVEAMLRKEREEVPPIDHAAVLDLYDRYDADVRYTDDRVGEVLDLLDSSGLAGGTIVALVGDHGQALGQHDWLEHGQILSEVVHVPMIVRLPPGSVPQPQAFERVVSTIDLLPTLLARVGHAAAAEFARQSEGSDLLDPAFDRPFAFSHRAERARDWEPGRAFGLTLERWRYYHVEEGEDRLFDLEADPAELHDVAAAHAGEVEKLRRIVLDVLAARPAGDVPTGHLTAEERAQLLEELRATGYLGEDEEPAGSASRD